MPHRHLALLLAATLTVPALTTAGEPRSISVAAAASMKPDFEEIANGAPFDLFLSADAEYPERIAIANPHVAPYGRAAVAALEKADVYEAVTGRIIMGQNVSQTAPFAQSGNARAAFLPLSLATVPPLSEHAAVVIEGTRQPALARELVAFILGDAARRVLARCGYDLPAK
jgi:ABC-type molybdate transport system substrate-binding protein